jgi:hypothetical protein
MRFYALVQKKYICFNALCELHPDPFLFAASSYDC